jgi:hypothetical protein
MNWDRGDDLLRSAPGYVSSMRLQNEKKYGRNEYSFTEIIVD